jgi:hypothetical protein
VDHLAAFSVCFSIGSAVGVGCSIGVRIALGFSIGVGERLPFPVCLLDLAAPLSRCIGRRVAGA